MQTDYRIAKQVGGKGAFAHVFLTLKSRAVDEGAIVLSFREMNSEKLPVEWVNAIEQGCARAVALTTQRSNGPFLKCIEVERLIYMIVDTTPEVVSAAATMASLKALGHGDEFNLALDGSWKISAR